MILELHHMNDGTVQIVVPGAGYAAPRSFGWYSDAISILSGNYQANYQYGYNADSDTGRTRVEIWDSESGENLPFVHTV